MSSWGWKRLHLIPFEIPPNNPITDVRWSAGTDPEWFPPERLASIVFFTCYHAVWVISLCFDEVTFVLFSVVANKRNMYDRYGKEGLTTNNGGGGESFLY